MATTTVRIEDNLKARVAAAAALAGKTSHAFILDAITKTVEQAEQDEAFHRLADQRWSKLLTTGKTVPFEDARAYIEARAAGATPSKPLARKAVPDTPNSIRSASQKSDR